VLLALLATVLSAGQRNPPEPNPHVRNIAPVLAPDLPAIGVAAFRGELKTLRDLIASGTAVESAGRDKRAPLLLASAGGHVEVVSLLLDSGANLNARDSAGATALHWVCGRREEKVVHLLLGHHAEVNVPDESGFTPLTLAVISGDKTIVEALLRAGARADFKDVYGWTASDWARKTSYANIAALLERTR